mmetsp:Transcript_111443/g.322190  ORF Transcript_111443/g.322190 Transcript_111443/m.322190 type:complete len:382 (-) Transcript_111443:3252-4397(-)
MVCELLVQRRLHRKRLVDESPVKVLLRLVNHDHSPGLGVELRPAGSTHHLQHIRNGEVDVALQLAVVVLGALDDDEVGREVDAPSQRGGADQHQDLRLHEQLLDDLAVPLWQSGMVDADAIGQSLLETRIGDPPLRVLQLMGLQLAKLLRVLVGVRGHERNDVEGSEARLPSRRHEDQGRLHPVFLHGMVFDGVEARLVHLSHPRHEMLLGIALDVRCHRHGPHGRFEVEEADDANAEPIGDVMRVREGRAETNEADLLVEVARDVTHPGHDHLEHWSAILPKQVDLVDDDEADLPHVRSVLPMARDAVPLLGRRHDDVRTLKRIDIRSEVTGEFHDGLPELALHTFLPILHALTSQRLQRSDVDDLFVGLVVKQAKHRQL